MFYSELHMSADNDDDDSDFGYYNEAKKFSSIPNQSILLPPYKVALSNREKNVFDTDPLSVTYASNDVII